MSGINPRALAALSDKNYELKLNLEKGWIEYCSEVVEVFLLAVVVGVGEVGETLVKKKKKFLINIKRG